MARPSSSRKQKNNVCQGTSRKNRPCKNRVSLPNDLYCRHHGSQQVVHPAKERSKDKNNSVPEYKNQIIAREKKRDKELNQIKCPRFDDFNHECRRIQHTCNEDILVLEAENKDPDLIERMRQKADLCYTPFTDADIEKDLNRIIQRDKSIIMLYTKNVGKQGIDEWTQMVWEQRTGRPNLEKLPNSGCNAMYIYGGKVVHGTSCFKALVSKTKGEANRARSSNKTEISGIHTEGQDRHTDIRVPSSLDFVNECGVRKCELCSEEHKITEYTTAKCTREAGGTQNNVVDDVLRTLRHARGMPCKQRLIVLVDGGFWKDDKIQALKKEITRDKCFILRQCRDTIVQMVA